jgi:hypothetical protein
MTFIAAFRSSDAIVFGADTQETQGGYKVYAEKIRDVEFPWGTMVLGGSGSGELSDAFEEALRDELGTATISSLADLQEKLKEILRVFHREDVAYAHRNHNRVKFLIGASIGSDVMLWQNKGQRLIQVPKFGIVGYDAAVYKYFARTLYPLCEHPSQMVLVMAYLIGIAKQTADGVSGSSHITVLRRGRAFPEMQEYVDSLIERINEFRYQIDRFFFVSMDLCFNEDGFHGLVRQFENLLVMLRRKYSFETAQIAIRNANNPDWKGDAYPKLVPGTLHILASKLFYFCSKPFTTAACSPAESESIPSVLVLESSKPPHPETQKRNREKKNRSRGGSDRHSK